MTGRPASWAVGSVVGAGAVSIVIVGSRSVRRLGATGPVGNGRPFLLREGSQGVPLSRRRTCPDLAPCRLDAGRLSWLHRAGPSATLDKSSSVVRRSYGPKAVQCQRARRSRPEQNGPMDAETVVRQWIDAYNRSDWELDLALLAPNAVTEVIARERGLERSSREPGGRPRLQGGVPRPARRDRQPDRRRAVRRRRVAGHRHEHRPVRRRRADRAPLHPPGRRRRRGPRRPHHGVSRLLRPRHDALADRADGPDLAPASAANASPSGTHPRDASTHAE